jgi:hypothetical protein
MLIAAMAGVAGYTLIAVEVILVYLPHHCQHLPGDHFVVIFIARKVPLNMASRAAHAETNRKTAHGLHHFVRLQDFEVLWRPHWTPPASAARRRRFLSQSHAGEKNYR